MIPNDLLSLAFDSATFTTQAVTVRNAKGHIKPAIAIRRNGELVRIEPHHGIRQRNVALRWYRMLPATLPDVHLGTM